MRPVDRPSRRPAASRAAAVLLALAAVALLGGCQLVGGTARTIRAVGEETGARDVSIEVEGVADHTVEVAYVSGETGEAAVRAEAEQVAGIVWREFPVRMQRVRIVARGTPAGVGAVTFERDELEARFGARDPDLDRGIGARLWPVVIGGVAALLVAGLLTAVIAVVAVRRRERRRESARAGRG